MYKKKTTQAIKVPHRSFKFLMNADFFCTTLWFLALSLSFCRREAVHLWDLWEKFHEPAQHEAPPPHPHRGETVPLWGVWPTLPLLQHAQSPQGEMLPCQQPNGHGRQQPPGPRPSSGLTCRGLLWSSAAWHGAPCYVCDHTHRCLQSTPSPWHPAVSSPAALHGGSASNPPFTPTTTPVLCR